MLWKIPPWIPGSHSVPAHWGSLPSSWHKHSASLRHCQHSPCPLPLGCPFGIWALEDVFPGIKAQGEHLLVCGKPQDQAGQDAVNCSLGHTRTDLSAGSPGVPKGYLPQSQAPAPGSTPCPGHRGQLHSCRTSGNPPPSG